MKDTDKKISKLLSLVLRHQPDYLDLHLDAAGWYLISDLIQKVNLKGGGLDFDILKRVVDSNDKKRFDISADMLRIRANQGHSIPVDLNLEAQEPPEYLYHGTVDRFIKPIREEGLKKMSRQYVHLSSDLETAIQVAKRRGKPLVLRIKSGELHKNQQLFYKSKNGVWLTTDIAPQYIIIDG